jgi:hypothetical protein
MRWLFPRCANALCVRRSRGHQAAAQAAAGRAGADIGCPAVRIAAIQPRMASRPLVIASDRRQVRHAAWEIGKLDQIAAALILGQRPNGEAVGHDLPQWLPGVLAPRQDADRRWTQGPAPLSSPPLRGVHSPAILAMSQAAYRSAQLRRVPSDLGSGRATAANAKLCVEGPGPQSGEDWTASSAIEPGFLGQHDGGLDLALGHRPVTA